MSKKLLFHQLQDNDQLGLFQERYEVPSYIKNNVASDLRYYQEEALRYLHYTQKTDNANFAFNHLLFHMATGSGKTLVLAAAMLYYYQEHGYQNFIFFVDSTPIIDKTRENLLNSSSPKYLFANRALEIEGKQVLIEEVETFPYNPDPNTIYLKLSTIHKLHDELGSYRENGVTYEDLKMHDLILLGDEAHHFNAATKSTKNQKVAAATWENTIERILGQNPKNRLLEFTATIDLSSKELFNKYQNKIVYQYDLKQFMKDRFSKNVSLMRADEDDEHKMLDAVLLSQYRKIVAQDYGIENFKPIILFKSNQVKVSEESEQKFINLIEALTADQVQKHLTRKKASLNSLTSVWHKVVKYYSKIELQQVIEAIKVDFNSYHLLNANRQNMMEDNAILLNTLEEIDNPIRAIFAVAKLNEGWDVLNLFDIVRISEKASTTRSTTDSEAQLIGRGARYYPFVIEEEKSYARRYDHTNHDLTILETLHYHTINDSSYIKNLRKSIDSANLQVSDDGDGEFIEAKLKADFLKSDIYRNGKLYLNETQDLQSFNYTLKDYGIDVRWETDFIKTSHENLLGQKANIEDIQRHVCFLRVDKRYLRKALQKNSFYHFNNLQKYFPKLTTIHQFMNDADYLGELSIGVHLPLDIQLGDLTAEEKLSIIERFLFLISDTIRRNYKRSKGLKTFKPIRLQEVIKDYSVMLTSQDQLEEDITQRITPKPTTGKKWYVYDNAILNGLEHNMVDLFDTFIRELNTQYEEVYLIRNDEKTTRFKLTEFDGYRGFMPDFILYLKDADFNYQVIVEPKGQHLVEHDKWKEDFMEELCKNEELTILGEDQDIRLLGFKFYTKENLDDFIADIENKIFDGKPLIARQGLLSD